MAELTPQQKKELEEMGQILQDYFDSPEGKEQLLKIAKAIIEKNR